MTTRHLALAGAAIAALAACDSSAPSDGAADSDPARPEGSGTSVAHVHGLGVDPADGVLYAATHVGVFRIEDDDEEPLLVADRRQDTMAFTVTGPETFLASGHPDPREDLPGHLGLIESTDAAVSWTPVSLAGEADFHALESADGRTYGFDAVSGRLITSTDRSSWTSIADASVIDLAWLGGDPDVVLASTPDGLTEYSVDGTATDLADEPPVVLVDSPATDTLVGVTGAGRVHSTDDPSSGVWRAHGSVPGAPQAFEATADTWYVATDRGIFASSDRGREWRPVLRTPGHAS